MYFWSMLLVWCNYCLWYWAGDQQKHVRETLGSEGLIDLPNARCTMYLSLPMVLFRYSQEMDTLSLRRNGTIDAKNTSFPVTSTLP
jgi:hypothetical protein